VGGGFATTIAVLEQTKNDAATPVLLAALDGSERDIQAAALRVLVQRRNSTGHRELIVRWHFLSERLKRIAAEKAGRMTSALRAAVLSPDKQLATNGCHAVAYLCDYDLVPALVAAVEDKTGPCARLAAETLLSLAESLAEELAQPRDYRDRRDPHLFRRHVVGALEQSAGRFEHHKRPEILEALLLLTDHDSTSLNQILRHPHEPAYVPVMHILSQSPRHGILRLVLNYLSKPNAPTALDGVISRRRDLPFVRSLLSRFAEEIPQPVRNHLKRIESFSWLREDMNLLSALNDDEQQGAINVTLTSGMSRLRVFEVVRFVLLNGKVGGRRAAAKALREFHGNEANELIVRALDDEDPLVQANVAP